MEIGNHNFVNNGEDDFPDPEEVLYIYPRTLRLAHLTETFMSFKGSTARIATDNILNDNEDYFRYKSEPVGDELFINPNYILAHGGSDNFSVVHTLAKMMSHFSLSHL